jgi:hypothetical protein
VVFDVHPLVKTARHGPSARVARNILLTPREWVARALTSNKTTEMLIGPEQIQSLMQHDIAIQIQSLTIEKEFSRTLVRGLGIQPPCRRDEETTDAVEDILMP